MPPKVRPLILIEPLELGAEGRVGAAVTLDASKLLLIGRHPSCAIRVPMEAQTVSARHAEIRFDDERKCYLLRDLGSSNGTFVNDDPFSAERVLSPGDIVRLGEGGPGFRVSFDRAVRRGARTQVFVPATISGPKRRGLAAQLRLTRRLVFGVVGAGLLAILIALLVVVLGPPPPDAAPSAMSKSDGQQVMDWAVAFDGDGAGEIGCHGVLLSANRLLTADHCIHPHRDERDHTDRYRSLDVIRGPCANGTLVIGRVACTKDERGEDTDLALLEVTLPDGCRPKSYPNPVSESEARDEHRSKLWYLAANLDAKRTRPAQLLDPEITEKGDLMYGSFDAQSGFSGGPIFFSDARLLGIHTAALVRKGEHTTQKYGTLVRRKVQGVLVTTALEEGLVSARQPTAEPLSPAPVAEPTAPAEAAAVETPPSSDPRPARPKIAKRAKAKHAKPYRKSIKHGRR